jgi:hypothetical protein
MLFFSLYRCQHGPLLWILQFLGFLVSATGRSLLRLWLNSSAPTCVGTVATKVPNFVRGMTVSITLLFQLLRAPLGIQGSTLIVGFLCMVIALFSLWCIQETLHKDLDYFEEYL